ncbi:hypothetical protein QR680_010462 [Steinernema hermaphroditum]|uniref:PABS domain-containing protein n=1 Tax=Steinernema hermaphroditum TaxID=289476 RepID=A0AA39IP33_9BILA|nr:hypothetical protein QR680_010462 [Steinernema hermaphroditum]
MWWILALFSSAVAAVHPAFARQDDLPNTAEADHLNHPTKLQELDVMCSRLSDDCYVIKQALKKDFQVVRFMEQQGYSKSKYHAISAINMKMDSSGNVKFNHGSITIDYIATMIAAPYMTGALEFGRPGHVLRIGLGGGSLDMFLHSQQPQLRITVVELDPTMVELAKKWFGAVDDERRRTVIGDGADFVVKAAREGTKFDVIALDACNSADEMFKCPARAFYDRETMESVKEALTDTGILVINVLSSNNTILYSTLRQYFAVCFSAQMQSQNQVTACMKNEPEGSVMKAFRKASKMLGFDSQLAYVNFVRF